MMKHKKPYTRFNLSESRSDINIFVDEYRHRIHKQQGDEENNIKSGFYSFAEKKLSFTDLAWLNDNDQRFFLNTYLQYRSLFLGHRVLR